VFKINVDSAYDLKHLNIVVIEGEVEGSLEVGGILVEKDNINNEYVTKGLVFVNGTKTTTSNKRMDIQLVAVNYIAEELVGKTLVNKI